MLQQLSEYAFILINYKVYREIRAGLLRLKFHTYTNCQRFTNLHILSKVLIISYSIFYTTFITIYIYLSYEKGIPETYVFGNHSVVKIWYLLNRAFSGYLLLASGFGFMLTALILIKHLISIQCNLKLLHVSDANEHRLLKSVQYQRKVKSMLRQCVKEIVKNNL